MLQLIWLLKLTQGYPMLRIGLMSRCGRSLLLLFSEASLPQLGEVGEGLNLRKWKMWWWRWSSFNWSGPYVKLEHSYRAWEKFVLNVDTRAVMYFLRLQGQWRICNCNKSDTYKGQFCLDCQLASFLFSAQGDHFCRLTHLVFWIYQLYSKCQRGIFRVPCTNWT